MVVFFPADLDDLAEYKARGELLGSVAEILSLLGAVDAFETDSDGLAAAENVDGVAVDELLRICR